MSRHCLNLKQSIGFNKDLVGGVHSLFDTNRDAVIFPASHTLIYQDTRLNKQQFLQGHANAITAVAVSNDKKWIVSADDGGQDALIIIWNSVTLQPLRTYVGTGGAIRLDLSDDGALIAVLTSDRQDGFQYLQIFEWATPSENPAVEIQIPKNMGFQRDIRFNPADYRELISNSPQRTVFWTWVEILQNRQIVSKLAYHSPDILANEFKTMPSAFTVSCFLPNTTAALTATNAGEVVLYDISGKAFQKDDNIKYRQPIKLLVLHTSSGNSAPIMPSSEIREKEQEIILEKCDAHGDFGHTYYMVPGQQFVNGIVQSNENQIQQAFYKYLTSATISSQGMTGGATQSFTQAITYMHAKTDGFIITGGVDGAVRMFDFRLRLLSWYENLESGPITSISIAMPQQSGSNGVENIDLSVSAVQLMPGQTPREFANKNEALDAKYGSVVLRDFVVGTQRGSVILVPAAIFEFIQPEKRRGMVLYQGLPGNIKCQFVPKDMSSLPVKQAINVNQDNVSQPLMWIGTDRGDLILYDFTSGKILKSNNIVGEIYATGDQTRRLTGTLAQRHSEGFEQASYLLPVHPNAPIKTQTYPHLTSLSLYTDKDGGQIPILLAGTNLGSCLMIDPFRLTVLSNFKHIAKKKEVRLNVPCLNIKKMDIRSEIRFAEFCSTGDIIAIVDEATQLTMLNKTANVESKMNLMTGEQDRNEDEEKQKLANNTMYDDIFNPPERRERDSQSTLQLPPCFVMDLEDEEDRNEKEQKEQEMKERRTKTGVRIPPAAMLAKANQKRREAASTAGQWQSVGRIMISDDTLNFDSVISCQFLQIKLMNDITNEYLKDQKKDPLIILSKDRYFTIIDVDKTINQGETVIVFKRFHSDCQAVPTAFCYLQKPPCFADSLSKEEFVDVVNQLNSEPDPFKREIAKCVFSIQSAKYGQLNASLRPELQPVFQRDLLLVANNEYKIQLRDPCRLPLQAEISSRTVVSQGVIAGTQNPEKQVLAFYNNPGYETKNFTVLQNTDYQSSQTVCNNSRLVGTFPLRKTVLGPTFADPISQMAPIAGYMSDFRNDVGSSEVTEGSDGRRQYRYRTQFETLSITGQTKHIPQYIAFAAPRKVIGMMRTPLDGAQHRYLGIIAHAGEILKLDTCFCSQSKKNGGNTYTVTSGKTDSTIFLWQVDYSSLDLMIDAAVTADQQDFAAFNPFLNQIEGGAGGDFYRQIQEFFSYAQIFSSEEKGVSPSEDARAPVSMLPDMLRALGVYLCNEHMLNAIAEITEEAVRYERLMFTFARIQFWMNDKQPILIQDMSDGGQALYAPETSACICEPDLDVAKQIFGELLLRPDKCKDNEVKVEEDQSAHFEKVDNFLQALWDKIGQNEITLSLDDFVRILVNYRQVFEYSFSDIESSFLDLGADKTTKKFDKMTLLRFLFENGEKMTEGEAQDCLGLLSGKTISNTYSVSQALPEDVTVEYFATQLLGFDENADEEQYQQDDQAVETQQQPAEETIEQPPIEYEQADMEDLEEEHK